MEEIIEICVEVFDLKVLRDEHGNIIKVILLDYHGKVIHTVE